MRQKRCHISRMRSGEECFIWVREQKTKLRRKHSSKEGRRKMKENVDT